MLDLTNAAEGLLDPVARVVQAALSVAEGLSAREVMVGGACCRDILHSALGHSFATTATRDLDLALALTSWDAYRTLAAAFPRIGDTGIWFRIADVNVDLLPFGEIEDPQGVVEPPSRRETLSVWAFDEIFAASLPLVLSPTLTVVAGPVLVYFRMVNTSLMVLICVAGWEFLSQHRRKGFARSEQAVASQLGNGVSVIVPSYNEEVVIVTSVQALLSLRYARHEVIVVDDGSTDSTFELLLQAFDLVPISREVPADVATGSAVLDVHVPRDGRTRLVLVRKRNSGRSDSINVGINAAVESLVAFIDADSILEPDALIWVTKPFADDPTRVVGCGGVIRAVNGCKIVDGRMVKVRLARPWLVRIQVVEYLRAFILGRSGWSRFGALILISGAFGIFRRDVLVEVGGLDAQSIGEDFELVMRIHRYMIDNHRDLPGDLCGRAGFLDGGAGEHHGPPQPAQEVASGVVGDPVEVPWNALEPALWQGRAGGHSVLLGLRADRTVPGACRVCPGRAGLRARGGGYGVRAHVHGSGLWLRHPGDPCRHDDRGTELP